MRLTKNMSKSSVCLLLLLGTAGLQLVNCDEGGTEGEPTTMNTPTVVSPAARGGGASKM